MTPLPAAALAGALATLPGMGPAALHALLVDSAPADVWDAILRGEVTRPGRQTGRDNGALTSWKAAAAAMPVAERWHAWRRQGIGVTWPGDGAFPQRLRNDPEPPGVMFWRGCLDGLAGRCVAIVGTRHCSPDGRATAYEMGRDLAAAGVCVVSGLALGIDGAAQLGALDGASQAGAVPCRAPVSSPHGTSTGGRATVGIAASGVDVPYPRNHAALWSRVVAEGAVVSETPPGSPAQAWRFPARNRVIAGLADLVVVVESHATGGSLITAEKALDRGVEVRVVPGPVYSPAAAGTNGLLYDGAGPVRDAGDVLDALGVLEDRPRRLPHRRRAPRADQLRLAAPPAPPSSPAPPLRPATPAASPAPSRSPALPSPPVTPAPLRPACEPATPPDSSAAAPASESLDEAARAVLDAVDWRPTALARIVDRSGFGVAAASAALEDLLAARLVGEHGGWWSRTARNAGEGFGPVGGPAGAPAGGNDDSTGRG